jgi:YbbR domain-containing protein
VTVTVDIIRAPNERVLNVPVRLRNLETGLTAQVEPPTIKVRARGTKASIDKLKDASILAYVDLDGIGDGDYGLPVRVDPTPGIGVDQLDPTVVRIHVQ